MTIKQKKALELLAENGGNVSKAMRDAGYSPQTAKTPQKLTQANGIKELIEQYIPLDKVFKTTKDLMEADTPESYPDWNARSRGVGLALKVHGIDNGGQTHVGDNIQIVIPTYGEHDNLSAAQPSTPERDQGQSSPIQDIELAP